MANGCINGVVRAFLYYEGGMTGKQKAFVEAYANPNSKTINNARASALAAHYSIATANQACVILVDNCSIKEGIEQYLAKFRAEQAINVEFVRQKHLQAMEICLENKDMVNYTRNLEGLGKSAGVYIDKTQELPAETQALDAEQQIQAQVLAELSLKYGGEIRARIERESKIKLKGA